MHLRLAYRHSKIVIRHLVALTSDFRVKACLYPSGCCNNYALTIFVRNGMKRVASLSKHQAFCTVTSSNHVKTVHAFFCALQKLLTFCLILSHSYCNLQQLQTIHLCHLSTSDAVDLHHLLHTESTGATARIVFHFVHFSTKKRHHCFLSIYSYSIFVVKVQKSFLTVF